MCVDFFWIKNVLKLSNIFVSNNSGAGKAPDVSKKDQLHREQKEQIEKFIEADN